MSLLSKMSIFTLGSSSGMYGTKSAGVGDDEPHQALVFQSGH